jgi:hypothetical protein
MKRPFISGLPREHALEVRPGTIGIAEFLVEERRRPLRKVDLDVLGESGRAVLRHHRRNGLNQGLRVTRRRRQRGQSIP